MLHAIKSKKSKSHERYKGLREDGERHVREEDEVTSIILGPLDFLPTQEAYSFWKQLADEQAPSEKRLPTEPPADLRHQFWPRRPVKDGGWVEPDLVVRLKWPECERILLVELKWRAPLSGKDQLRRQWSEFLTNSERQDALHLFIAPETSAAHAEAAINPNLWSGSLLAIPWLSVRGALAKVAQEESGLARWAARADFFLGQIGIHRFRGFSALGGGVSISAAPMRETIFWTPIYWEIGGFSDRSFMSTGHAFFAKGVD